MPVLERLTRHVSFTRPAGGPNPSTTTTSTSQTGQTGQTGQADDVGKVGGKGVAGMRLPELPATSLQEKLSVHGTSHPVHAGAGPKLTLSLDEIAYADPKERGDLMRRYGALSGFLAEQRAGRQTRPPMLSIPGVSSDGKTVRIAGVPLGAAPRQEQIERALASLLPRLHDTDDAVRMMAHLFGTDGALLRKDGDLPVGDGERFHQPMFFCWDYNGTVEREPGILRSGMDQTLHALNRMGSASALTTSMAPEGAEKVLVEHQVPFVSYYGDEHVRPLPGNKVYEGIARTFGVDDANQAHKRMVVLGDSVTDAALDMPGVLHLQVDATVPGPALEVLLHAIDVASSKSARAGDITAGVDALVQQRLGRSLHDGERVELSVGPLSFTVEMRAPKLDPRDKQHAGAHAPIIHGLRIDLDDAALAHTLAGKHDDFAADRDFRLAFFHLGDSLAEQQVPSALAACMKAGAGSVASQAIEHRRALWQHDVDQATRAITPHTGKDGTVFPSKLEQWLHEPLRMDDLLERMIPLAQAGDPAVAKALHAALADFRHKDRVLENNLHQGLDSYAAALKDALRKAPPSTSRSLKKPTADEEQALSVLLKLAERPDKTVPLDAKGQKAALAQLARVLAQPPPGAGALLAKIHNGLAAALEQAHLEVSDRFAERRARHGDVKDLLGYADVIAQQRTSTWRQIDAALGR